MNTPNSEHANPGQRNFGNSAAAKDVIFGSSDGSDDDEYDDDDDTDDEDDGLTGDDAEHEWSFLPALTSLNGLWGAYL